MDEKALPQEGGHIERATSSQSETAGGDVLDGHLKSSDQELKAADKKLLRKVDLALIPWLTLLYLASFLDRTNIGNAKIDNLIPNLHMTNGQYSAALSLFFVSYALFEPLTNVLLKILTPRKFLTVIITLWGIVMVTMGLVHNFSGLAAARFFLGVTEAGLFPGVNYFLSCWYKRSELGIRTAIFFSAAALAGSFGGLLAAAIALMDGIGGKHGWAWIFILEGLATVVIGLLSWFMVHDFPDEARFLTPEEKAHVLQRLRNDGQGSSKHEDFNSVYVWQSLKDWKTYLFMIIYAGADGPLYSIALFLPTIIKDLGYSSTRANLLSVPPYALAAICTILIGWIADRTKQRGLCNIIMSLFAIAGIAMVLGSKEARIQYPGVFLAVMGIYPTISNTITWTSNNVEGVYKRGVTMGLVIGFGNLNGIMSSNVYIAKQAPKFATGNGTVLGYLAVMLLGGSVVARFLLAAENRKRRAGRRDYLIENKTEEQLRVLGDNRPDFMYTL